MAARATTPAARYDVFNGDADGICALHQYRLAFPHSDAELVTGVKRDIGLLARLIGVRDSAITVLDISMHVNIEPLRRLLADGNDILYVDHHFAGDIPEADNLTCHLDPDPEQCTALIVDRLIGAKHRSWAICGAFGDNLHRVAEGLAANLSLSVAATGRLREIGELLNYNGYGGSLDDLYFRPDDLYRSVSEYRDPFDFYRESSTLQTLQTGFANDMEMASSQQPFAERGANRVWRFPDSPWARRVSGVFANLKARENPAGAHALITENSDSTLRISVRAPLADKRGADTLCRSFPSGGGRAAAAGINALPEDRLETFIDQFNRTYG